MTHNDLTKLKYPIGEFKKPEIISSVQIGNWISDIEKFPERIISEIKNLSRDELNYCYRPNGWTIKQVVHHCADSHINSLTRFKLTLTEDKPTIKPYFEDRWAQLIDYEKPIASSISILEGVHIKLGILLRGLSESDLQKDYTHPEHNKNFSLEETIGMYAWHSNHHLAHIKQALYFKGKFE